ncbi:MAG: HupE/UreJ family protein [Minicystis sp.]
MSLHGARPSGVGLASIVALALVIAPAPARAHEVGLSRGDFTADGNGVRADVAFARKELASLVAGLDENHDGQLTQAELDAGRDSIQGAIVGRIKVTGDGLACTGKLDRVELADQDGVAIRALYRCPQRPKEASIKLALIEDLPFGHRHLARAFAATGPLDLVLSQRVPSFSFTLPAETSAPATAPSTPALFAGGAKHAATAWPLPVFLIGLLARSTHVRGALASAGAFVAALLAGLVIAAVGLFTPSPQAVTIAVALSLAYVGVDNFAGGERKPWIALPFGVVHGLGCAVALRGLAAPPGGLAPFAGGVLAVALAFCAAIVPVVLWISKRPAFKARGVGALSAVVLAAGLVGLRVALYSLAP